MFMLFSAATVTLDLEIQCRGNLPIARVASGRLHLQCQSMQLVHVVLLTNAELAYGDSGDWAEGNMWSCSAFSEHLDASCAQKGLWQNHIQPQMQRIVQYSLACATVSIAPYTSIISSLLSVDSCTLMTYVLLGGPY